MIGAFHERFGPTQQPRVFRAPGRVNLIGEHTDYNLGFVLPVALDLATYIAVAPSGDGKLRIYSEDRKEQREFDASSLGSVERTGAWTDYPIGVAQELVRAAIPVEGANLLIRSTVPDGSGLSSSAALEVSSALALLGGWNWLSSASAPNAISWVCRAASWTSTSRFSGARTRRWKSIAAAWGTGW
jgi:galactokinase